MKKRVIVLVVFTALIFQSYSQRTYLWATGSTVGSYYNFVNYYTNNYLSPWPYSRSTMVPLVTDTTDTEWIYMESSSQSLQASAGIKSDGRVWNWVKNGSLEKVPDITPISTTDEWKQVLAGIFSSRHGLRSDGTLWRFASPMVQWGTDSDWKEIVCWIDKHFYAIKNDGTLWHLTTNTATGNPDQISQVGTDSDWKKAIASSNGTLTYAIKTDGTLWKYVSQTQTFQQEGTDTDWVDCKGSGTVIFKKSNGTLWGVGVNQLGQLGLGHNQVVNTITQIGTDTDWKDFSGNGTSTYAIKTDSTLWAWGDNSSYTLANGNNISSNIPIHVGVDHSWLHVSATTLGAFAVRTYGYAGPGGSSTAGFAEDAFNQVVIYPNPVSDVCLIQGLPGKAKIEIINSSGAVCKSIQADSATLSLDIRTLERGIYFIDITNENGQVRHKLIVTN